MSSGSLQAAFERSARLAGDRLAVAAALHCIDPDDLAILARAKIRVGSSSGGTVAGGNAIEF